MSETLNTPKLESLPLDEPAGLDAAPISSEHVPSSRVGGAALAWPRHFGWVVGDVPLSSGVCVRIEQLARMFPAERARSVADDVYASHRVAETRKIEPITAASWLLDFLCLFAEEANRRHYHLDLTQLARPPEHVVYVAGEGRFDWHNDYSHESDFASRKLTLIVQLSDPAEYDGGELELFDFRRQVLPMTLGSVIAFPSLLFHRVRPVTRGARTALVAWIGGPYLR